MSYKDYLSECINLYYSKIIDNYRFSLIESNVNGIGAYSTYQNDLLLFKITNDRGLVSSELAPLFSKNQFIEVHYIIRMIRIKEIESLGKNSFERKLVVSRKYSCEEQVTLIEKYYDSIISMFSEDQFDDTIKRIYKL